MTAHSEDFIRLANEARSRIRGIPPQQAKELIENGALLLDVREKDEFDQHHLPEAKHLSRGVLENEAHHGVPYKY